MAPRSDEPVLTIVVTGVGEAVRIRNDDRGEAALFATLSHSDYPLS